MKWVLTVCDQFPTQAILMRVLSCKFKCPSLVCFSKSSFGLFSSPLKLEDGQHASSSPPPIPDAFDGKLLDEKVEEDKEELHDVKVEVFLKSSLKRPRECGSKDVGKGRVKWMDFMGKELVEIKEFETSDSGDSDDDDVDGNRGCVCVIQ